MVRPSWVQTYGSAEAGTFFEENQLSLLRSAVGSLVTGNITVEVMWEVVESPYVERLWGPHPEYGGVRFIRMSMVQTERRVWQIDSRLAKGIFDCGISMISGVEAAITGPAGETADEVETSEFLIAAADLAMRRMQDLHRDHFGGPPPTPTCGADFYEPNESWRSAIASGTALSIGTEPVRITDLTLCSAAGGEDDDWYAFNMAPISLNTDARIRMPTMAGPLGTDRRVCLEVWFYSENYEIGGWDADLVRGSVCDTVASEFSLGRFSIARTTGESYSFLVAHVYPEDPTYTGEIDYDLGFTL